MDPLLVGFALSLSLHFLNIHDAHHVNDPFTSFESSDYPDPSNPPSNIMTYHHNHIIPLKTTTPTHIT